MKKRHLFPISLPDYNQNSIITALRTNIEIGNTDTYRAISNVIIDVLSNSGSLIITDDEIPEFFITLNAYPHPTYFNYFDPRTLFFLPITIRFISPQPIVFTSKSNLNLTYAYKLTYNTNNNEVYTYNNNLLKLKLSDLLLEELLLAFLNYKDLPKQLKDLYQKQPSLYNYSWRKCNYTINNETKSITITKIPPESIYFPSLNCIFHHSSDGFWGDLINFLSGATYFLLFHEYTNWPRYLVINQRLLTITYDQNLYNIENIFSLGYPITIPAEDLVYHDGDFYLRVYPLKLIKEKLQNGREIIKIVVDKDNPEYITYKYFVAKALKNYGKKEATFIKQFIEIIGSWKYHHRWIPYTPTIFYTNVETNYSDKFLYGSYLDATNWVVFPPYEINNIVNPNIRIKMAPFQEAVYVKYNEFISDAFYFNILEILNFIFNYIFHLIDTEIKNQKPIITLFPYVPQIRQPPPPPPPSYNTLVIDKSHGFLPFIDYLTYPRLLGLYIPQPIIE